MARLVRYRYTPQRVVVTDDSVVLSPRYESLSAFPLIVWADGAPWIEASLWFTHKASYIPSGEAKLTTIHGMGWSLYAYAKWLEANDFAWHAFDADRADRPTTRYRGYLCAERDAGRLSPATVTSRMAAVVRFYRWVMSQGLLQPENPPFLNRDKRITVRDSFGFSQALTIKSSDLHIPNKQKGREIRLEDGLHPVSVEKRNAIMRAAREHCSMEFASMLHVGFDTGMRLQSILDLKIDTLESAVDGQTPHARYLRIGPQHGVSTKFGVNGRVFIPTILLEELKSYIYSPRRLLRQAKAAPEDRDILFLNRDGKRYNQRGHDKSPSLNVDMCRLRAATRPSFDMSDFYFHCTRATFATQIVTHGMDMPGVTVAAILNTVRELLLHKHEATSQRYITWVDQQKVKAHYEEQYGSWLFNNRENAA